MLGLLGLLGALIAGFVGDSVVNAQAAADADDAPPTDDLDTAPDRGGAITDEPAEPEVIVPAEPEVIVPPEPEVIVPTEPEVIVPPEPEVIVPTEELPGEGPVEEPDAEAQLLIGTDDAEWLTGGAGNDGLLGSGGADTLAGGAGNDAIVGADDDEADVLAGEDGNDSLTLGAGDEATGGEGEDLFTLADFGPNTPPSVITDYSAADDHIVLMYDPEVHPDPVVSMEQVEGTDHMSVLLDGVQIAIVQGAPGLTQADIQLMAA